VANERGGGNSVWAPVPMLLIGLILSGVAGVVRGDWLGGQAAASVEARTTKAHDELAAQAAKEREALERRLAVVETNYKEILTQLSEIKGFMRGNRRTEGNP